MSTVSPSLAYMKELLQRKIGKIYGAMEVKVLKFLSPNYI